MASVFKRGGKGNRGGSYYIQWFDHTGKRQSKSARTTDKATAERIAAKLEANVALRVGGIIDAHDDRYAHEVRRPLAEHLAEFKESLIGKDDTARHCRETYSQAQRVIARCAAVSIGDLTPSAVQAAIKSLREEGRGLQTCNHYLQAIKGFSRWLHQDKRIRDDALACLKRYNADTDPRYVRRELTPEELAWLIPTTERRTRPEHNLPGPDRAMAYLLALGTGFRARELRSLTPESFELDDDPPRVTVHAARSKRRSTDTQPIRRDLAELIRAWLSGRPVGQSLFAKLPRNTARMMRPDLKAARLAWVDAAANQQEKERRESSDFLRHENAAGEVVDFHATRHTYISGIVSGGASVKVAQELARHSTPTLTIGRYAHTRLHDLQGALDSLPGTCGFGAERETLRATGTDDAAPSEGAAYAQQSGRETVRLGATPCDDPSAGTNPTNRRNPLPAQQKSEPLRPSATTREEYPVGESNPCCRTENPESWATRRTGRTADS